MGILLPVLICFAIAAVCAIILTVSSLLFGVKEDEKFLAIRDALPGANCGACGYSGCDGYARALSEGKVKQTNLCTPGGTQTSEDVAAILGVKADKAVRKFAYIGCHGTCEATKKDEKHLRDGFKTCKEAAEHWGGENVCTFACVGLGDCAAACPSKAICMADGIAHVDTARCIGCGLCAKTCPKHIISMLPQETLTAVMCSNKQKGADARKACKNACIGCKKCEKVCPNGAITVIDNLAVVDYNKCTNCETCIKECPTGCLKSVFFPDKPEGCEFEDLVD